MTLPDFEERRCPPANLPRHGIAVAETGTGEVKWTLFNFSVPVRDVMFYIPSRDGADWGANAAGSPVFGGSHWFYTPDHSADAAPSCRRCRSCWSGSRLGPTDGTPAAMPPM